ncbi:MAG: response regulator [Desulfuromonadaceae bacterium]
MSLVGNLEELGLGEILQIVSLSRKTGVLSLSSRGRDGSVFFRQGQVVRAASNTYHQSLGEVLIQKGVIDLALLRKALAFQQENGFRQRLGVILVKNFGGSQEIIEEVVREQIENVIFSLFAWSEGTFKFESQNSVETVDGTKMDPLQFILDQGLNPQFLAMEGTRILDEKRNASEMGFAGGDSSGDAAAFTFDMEDGSNSPASSPLVIQQPVVIVDDDGPTLRTIADGLTENGFIVHAMTRSEDTLIMVDSLHRGGERPTVLIDLIMPKMDGSGVLGGIELLELLHNNFKDLQLIVMTDYHHAEAEKKIRGLGYSFIKKPRRVEINTPAIMGSFLTRITDDIRHSSDATASGEWQSRFNLGDELRIEMGEDDDMPRAVESPQPSGGLSLLRGMLEELNNPDLQGGVLLLVLRFASELVNRAIVFTIQDQIISGFGQFGITDGTISGNDRVRAIHFPQESGSIFDEPLRTGQPATFSPIPTPVDSHFFEQLGGGIPAEVFVGSLISRSRVIGFLYGDNLPDKKPIGDIEPLAIFLAQAGISMEKSLLERQLYERVMP